MTGLVIAVIGGGLFLFAYGIILWRVLGQRLDRIEQWERWIVKLQKQIKELQKAGTAPRDLYWNRQITDLQQA
ncbi:MAG: hypothetical protein GTO63_12610, partial [Anaerolineae bacterium]|nr:hypothetical protein [Anaerolineae bacterium]NIN95732.1 hypothetical protein [Anaerolineae bacterium]